MGLLDSSEFQHAASLLRQLGARGRLLSCPQGSVLNPPAGERTPRPTATQPTQAQVQPTLPPPPIPVPPRTTPPAPLPVPPRPATPAPVAFPPMPRVAPPRAAPLRVVPLPEPASDAFLGDRMASILGNMCLRGGFTGAVLADRDGLPLADFNSPVSTDIIAACSSVLGSAMEHTAAMLNQRDANNISMDINYTEKVVLRRFEIVGAPYFLMVICPQAIDERSELEVSIEQITTVLGREL